MFYEMIDKRTGIKRLIYAGSPEEGKALLAAFFQCEADDFEEV